MNGRQNRDRPLPPWALFRFLSALCSLSYILPLALPLLSVPPTEAQDGYRLRPDRVRISGTEQWQAWTAPAGVRVFTADGAVEPRRLQRPINAALNAASFEYLNAARDTVVGGISAAGSNLALAPAIIDGDSTTFWEPEPDANLDDWFVEIDLGRALIADRVVVRFADEGDPLLKFRLLTADGSAGFDGRQRFFRVGLVNKPNKDQRRFEFAVRPSRPVPIGINGDIVQFIRLEALDTDGPRAQEIPLETFQALPPQQQGAVDYFRQTRSGRQLPVSFDTYQLLTPDERGPIRYYRREQPRLAEIEVYTLGENVVSLTQRERERDASEGGFDFLLFRIFTDGLFSPGFRLATYNPITDKNQVEIDLGAKYWLDRIKLLTPQGPPPAYQVRVSDGSINPGGEFIWTAFDERRNTAGYQHVEERFQQREVRYIEVRRLRFSGSAEEEGDLSEIQAYGEGFVSDLVMTSPFIRLQRPRLLTSVEWRGEAPPGTRIEVRTRSGDAIEEIPHYYALTGREISRVLWELLPESRRPPVEIEEVAGPDWSPWSEIYRQSGEAFKSPSPRPFVQAQIRLLSREPLRSSSISQLDLRFVPPLVDKVLGELWPARGIDPGVEQDFTLYLNPRFGSGNPGFDQVRLSTSAVAPIQLTQVRSGSETALRQGRGTRLWPGNLDAVNNDDGSVDLTFPQPVQSSGPIYAISFRTTLFLHTTIFSAQLQRQTLPGRIQLVSPGDATALASSQSLNAVSDLAGRPFLAPIKAAPPIFTPNGDGINDQTRFDLTVFQLEGQKRLEAGIYDLAGRRRTDLSQTYTHPSGTFALDWDGRDDHGRLLPPGIYIARFGLATDTGSAQRATIVHLVY